MIKAVTGTRDILPSENRNWLYLEQTVRNVFGAYNYSEIRTPVFEETTLFARSIGEETDIVGKEMYSFIDRSGTSLTLKPEMTAGVVRAFIEHSLGKQQPLNKLYYIAPMFRQERPQAGRQRQFHQFGAEALGSTSPLLDAEMIQMAYEILKMLGLKDLTVKINSLGKPSDRETYKKNLKDFLQDKKNLLSEDSRKRFDKNILRIFDSKVESDQQLLKGAPLLIDHLSNESVEHFGIVQDILRSSDIPFDIDAALVRGLDYYTETTFEILSGKVGSQSALCGGGRYDLLVEQLGGEASPGVGFAAGMERILLACQNENAFTPDSAGLDVYITALEKDLSKEVYAMASLLRSNGLRTDFDYLGRSLKAQMREANKSNARYVIFLGGDEYKAGNMNLKNMSTGEQTLIPVKDADKLIGIIRNDYKV